MKDCLANTLASMAQKGAKVVAKSDHKKMCSQCAFKAGSDANKEPDTILKAMEALVSPNMVFKCHEDKKEICGGYFLADKLNE